MATASAAPTASSARRRPRSGRLVGAILLLALAAVVAVAAVVVAITLDTATPWPVAAGLVVLALGAAATRSTHLELLLARREAGAERARLAQEYRGITDDRVAENATFTSTMRRRLDAAEQAGAEHLANWRLRQPSSRAPGTASRAPSGPRASRPPAPTASSAASPRPRRRPRSPSRWPTPASTSSRSSGTACATSCSCGAPSPAAAAAPDEPRRRPVGRTA